MLTNGCFFHSRENQKWLHLIQITLQSVQSLFNCWSRYLYLIDSEALLDPEYLIFKDFDKQKTLYNEYNWVHICHIETQYQNGKNFQM